MLGQGKGSWLGRAVKYEDSVPWPCPNLIQEGQSSFWDRAVIQEGLRVIGWVNQKGNRTGVGREGLRAGATTG